MRRGLDSEIRSLVERSEALLRDLDPVGQPSAVFDPADPSLVGRFVALALIAQPRTPLAEVTRFYGSGGYAIYYSGPFRDYTPIAGSETPIYVGKADPESAIARIPTEQGQKLANRLTEHNRNIARAESTLRIEDFDYRSLVVQSGWQGAAETYLINFFEPVWNSETNICYGIGKHGDAAKTRSNKRSPWDTMHPGRKWARDGTPIEDARPSKRIKADLKRHFASVSVFKTDGQVLKSFVDELRQL